MTQEQKIIRAKVGLLELAKQLGNVSPSSRIEAVFGWLPAVYQRVSLKGLHYGRGRLG